MNSISSSFFGRLFGNATKVIVNTHGMTVSIKDSITEISWQSLASPPEFHRGWLGQTMTFTTTKQHVKLSKLAYGSALKHNDDCQLHWVSYHKHRLENLLSNIDSFIKRRYLRQSGIERIEASIKQEYVRWFPWIASSAALSKVSELVQLLSNYKRWQTEDINAFRESYINKQLKAHQALFDNIESNPLTSRQRRACIIDDDNNLLLAGAGTGKTSVMVGRTGYLLDSQQATFNDILLLAYGRKAADEMDERIKTKLATDSISATTFHSLGLNIIKAVEGGTPNLSVFAENEKAKSQWLENCFEQLMSEQQHYRQLALQYFTQHYYTEKHDVEFDSLGEYYQYLTDNDIGSLKGEKIKSIVELHIADWLFSHGIEYRYQDKYQFSVQSTLQGKVKPAFFVPEFDLYIEYFSIDSDGNTASYIDRDDYYADMQKKRELHQLNQSQYIELTYAQHQSGQLLTILEKKLLQKKVIFNRLSDQAMLDALKASGRFKVLAKTFTQLIGLYKSACLDDPSELAVIENSADSQQTQKAFALLKPILDAYQAQLLARNEIDFEDMISNALAYVESGQFQSPWRYIMVDEFQDISEPRARLVKALRDSHHNCSVFAVGDDWQAIYRFSGADVSLTTDFELYFGATTQTQLDKTFRFNNRIGEVATDFVSKNPSQINKKISSFKQVDAPAVSILRKSSFTLATKTEGIIDEIANGALDEVLTAISAKVNNTACVYLLARYWFQLPNKATLTHLNKQYPRLDIEIHSFHNAKGKEADHVVILGLTSGKHGFPANKSTPAIIDALLAKQESFQYAEERRLFYVALTRAKDRVYIIADTTEPNCFVTELIESKSVELNEFDMIVNQQLSEEVNCLMCETGRLKIHKGRFGTFYACTHSPRCDHKKSACSQCESLMTDDKYAGFRSCLNPTCHHILPLCGQCGAEMVLRKSNKGEFWGCSNFKGNEANSCKNAIDNSKVHWPTLPN